MNLTVVRHGETLENSRGIIQGQLPGQLTDKGIAQADQLAYDLEHRNFCLLYSSDLLRCVVTADRIRYRQPDLPVVLTSLLREKHFGIYQGTPATSIKWNAYQGDNIAVPIPGGESFTNLATRVGVFLNDCLSKHESNDILVVTHGGPMRVISNFLGHTLMSKLVHQQIPNCAVMEFEMNESIEGLFTGR